uniref:E3 ubiquitin-protein ligase TRIM23-like n=1 Tax=Saccoglossus kowalevskii TaxID=10224 RepID=A0ABM0MY49_SACKO|nr:PREDICTED: E3 ubiquitin-protein ligase TRIM23-like [Saccoglossus kowalevskii]
MSASNPSQNDGCLEEPRGYYCSICYHGYKRDGQYVPRNLNCGHTFCTECLKKLSVVQRAGIITCPTCKAATVLGFANDTRKLPKNYALLEILEGLEEAAVSAGKGASLVPPPSSQASEDEETSLQNNPELFCQSHEKEPKKVYCITDKQKICIYCQVYGSHQGHECQLLSVVADEKRKNVSSLAETLSKQHDRFCEKRKQLSNAGYAIRFREEKLMREVTRHFEMLRKKLYRRELHLKSLIKNKTNGKMEVLEGKRKKCSEFIVTIEAARSSCQSVQSLSDHEVLEVKEVLQEKVRKLTDDANSYSVQATVEDDLFCQLDLTLSDTIMQYGVVGEDSGKAAALYNGSSSSGDSTEGASGGSSTSSSSTPETSSTEESNHDVNRYQLPTRTNKSLTA